METEYLTLAALMVEVTARREAGEEVLDANDAKTRRIGFVVGDDYLFVRMSRLSTEQLKSVPGFIEQPEPEMANLWDDGLMNDVMDKADELTEGERGAAVDQAKLPTPEKMAEWVAVVQAGIKQAGIHNMDKQSIGGSPFTFYWSDGDFKRHHVNLRLKTDHLGLDVFVAVQEGPLWGSYRYAKRIAWVDQAFSADWVCQQVAAAKRVFDSEPQCECKRHQDIRSGRVL